MVRFRSLFQPRTFRPRRPTRQRLLATAGLAAVIAFAVPVASTVAYLGLPTPTGPHGIGRTVATWTDAARPEARTADPGDQRAIRVVAWYPTDASGRPGPYLRDLDAIADVLVASGSVGAIPVAGLRLSSGHAIDDAPVSAARAVWPVILLSPGNDTNVEFYGAIAENLASLGFVVVGIDHPYQVGAVDLGGGRIAAYEGDAGLPGEALAAIVPRRIAERVADLRFALDRLAGGGLPALGASLDLGRIGVVGHSNGGIAAAEACVADERIDACLNIDGQAAGGPFSTTLPPRAPAKPFLYLTKETEMHQRLEVLFEEGGPDTYRVVVPAATHGAFTDGGRFTPRVLPLEGDADHTLRVARGFVAAFFNHELRGAPQSVFGAVDAPTDVLVEIYPLTRSG